VEKRNLEDRGRLSASGSERVAAVTGINCTKGEKRAPRQRKEFGRRVANQIEEN
jgi:hypothetical protein